MPRFPRASTKQPDRRPALDADPSPQSRTHGEGFADTVRPWPRPGFCTTRPSRRVALVELEVRELLKQYGYAGAEVPVVPVSATGALAGEERWVASVLALLDAVDGYLPDPVRLLDRPFLLPVENVMTISGRGTVVTGEVEQGVIDLGATVEVVGLGPT